MASVRCAASDNYRSLAGLLSRHVCLPAVSAIAADLLVTSSDGLAASRNRCKVSQRAPHAAGNDRILVLASRLHLSPSDRRTEVKLPQEFKITVFFDR